MIICKNRKDNHNWEHQVNFLGFFRTFDAENFPQEEVFDTQKLL